MHSLVTKMPLISVPAPTRPENGVENWAKILVFGSVQG